MNNKSHWLSSTKTTSTHKVKPDVLESLPGLYQRTEKGCLHSYCYCPDECNWMWTTKEQIVKKLRFQRLLYCSGILGQETSGKQVVDPCVGIDFRSICITVDMALSYLMCEKRGQGVRLQMSLMIEASLHMRGSLGKEEVRPSQDVALHQQAEVSPGPGFHFSQELLKSHSSREGVCLRHMDLSSPSVSLF